MGKRHFKNWLETFTLNPADFPDHEWTLYNDTDEHIRLDYQGRNTAEGQFIHRLAVQKTGSQRSSITTSRKPNEIIARVDANATATWAQIKQGLIESYENGGKELQGVVGGVWNLK
ncbi:hypothetical protein APSETT444_002661 [Aspergillus pseudonomiae]